MAIVRIVLGIICAVLWFGWFYLTALGCGFGHGSVCGPFQGNLEMTVAMVWVPLLLIAVLFFALWLIERWIKR